MTELNTNCVKVYGELLSFTPDDKVITVKDSENKQSNNQFQNNQPFLHTAKRAILKVEKSIEKKID